MRAFTSEYSSEVVGMVLVDASQEGQKDNYPAEWQKLDKTQNTIECYRHYNCRKEDGKLNRVQ